MNRNVAALCLALASLASCAGVERVLTVESTPPGAIVRLDERIIGKTPLEHEFDHYGTVRLTLYLEGFRTRSVRAELSPPWYGRFPVDLFTDFLWPLAWTDRHQVKLALNAEGGSPDAPDLAAVLRRARLAREGHLQAEPPPIAAQEVRAPALGDPPTDD
ncbi:MAG: hypothetical protein CMK00_01455 [Planctomycetes bacterium]|jgi:hypothetical protein|nr:hypothetical protein [Planctomycetota bacterium]HJO26644.1 PEGA domain-containing protein [Planctomycetota bacterium]